MSLRRKLLIVFALTVFLSVAAVAWIISSLTRRAFEKANEERTSALVAQFRREFDRRGAEVAQHVETSASSEAATHMALALSHGAPDYGAYLNEAKALAESQQLDFLEFVDSQGTIISSAQWPEIRLQGSFLAHRNLSRTGLPAAGRAAGRSSLGFVCDQNSERGR